MMANAILRLQRFSCGKGLQVEWMMKKVCVVTGTRAEYGLLRPVMKRLYRDDTVTMQLVATGMHLSSEFGMTYREIEEDGFPIHSKIEMLMSSDTQAGITKSMGVALLGFADYFAANRPDIVVLLGDRYETFAVAEAAMIARIPIAHIGGGEKTEGAMDEAIRHSISKMSHLHFTATEEYRKRVIQLGENPENVYYVGSLGIENIRTIQMFAKEEMERLLDFSFSRPTVMVTYHPVTLEYMTSRIQFQNLLEVLDRHSELSVIFTKANSDTDGRIINKMIDDYAAEHTDRCRAYASLGQKRYLSALQFCCAVMGNSSSGMIEVPSFGIPTVNIGDRQKGRMAADSVITCGNGVEDIEKALTYAMSDAFKIKCKTVKNPYEKAGTSETIVNRIKEALRKGISLKKEFYDIAL